ncbi:MAG: phosphoenolpyruvate--protein phosphotransferase [Gammaproteobacteria bacterium]|nr:phosphoenolpyruvate--protein phosphotransferase [Gammaproteobacteria bacterium]
MLTLHGAGVGGGVAIGNAFVLFRDTPEVPNYVVPEAQLDAEVERFQAAIRVTRTKMRKIRKDIPPDAPSEITSFLDAHMLMLNDPVLSEDPIQTIRTEGLNAESALQRHADSLTEVFETMEDAYLRSKKTDIAQVVSRIQNELLTFGEEYDGRVPDGLDGQIVVTNDLTPSDAVALRHQKMSAFITNLGGPISHTAILARSLRIPTIVGLHGAIRYIRHRDPLIVDGHNGVIIVDPDKSTLKAYRDRQLQEQRLQTELVSLTSAAAVTSDGERISLFANIELPEDIGATKAVDAGGVGLYRTEYMYMNRAEPPGEEEQLAAYVRVVSGLQRPITIRTLDLGADKQVDGGRPGGHVTINPALGLRAVRLCLSNPALFRPQLRAILRASAHGPIEIMIPMVSSLDELDQVLDLIEEIKRELTRDGHEFNENVPVGGMIEVPAAAIAADLFARKLDFLSIGTNDLIQYTLAIDRVDDEVNYLYDPLHPSVLRLIQRVIEAGTNAEIPVSMCGEMAGDVRYTRLLLGLGLRIFSMDPTRVLEVKKTIRNSSIESVTTQTCAILAATDSTELRDLVERMNRNES